MHPKINRKIMLLSLCDTCICCACTIRVCRVCVVCKCVHGRTAGDESLQQLLFGQALLHLHPDHVTAEPPHLLLWLVERERKRERGGGDERWDGEVRREHVVMETKEIYYYYCAPREMEQEENLNEQKGLFLPLDRARFPFLHVDCNEWTTAHIKQQWSL